MTPAERYKAGLDAIEAAWPQMTPEERENVLVDGRRHADLAEEVEALKAALAALRKRIDGAREAWIWVDHVSYSREAMDRFIGGRWGTEDVEHVRIVEEATP